MTRALLAVVVSIVAAGCSATTNPPADAASDASMGNDASRLTDASTMTDAITAIDASTMTDASTATDASTGNDASTASDASGPDDAGVNCAIIGCGPPPICGMACTAPCGCCPCADGTEMGTYVCQGGCWAPRGTGTDGSQCTMTSDCGSGLSCCYPCGIPGCMNVCTPTCTPGTPGCGGAGCVLHA